jgi:rhodanese-related sulfurtransferase
VLIEGRIHFGVETVHEILRHGHKIVATAMVSADTLRGSQSLGRIRIVMYPKGQNMPQSEGQFRPRELAERLAQPDPPLLVDVREPGEWQFCHLAGALHLPMNQLTQRLEELDRDREIVVYCHHGIRSKFAVDFLAEQGFQRVRNLVGGIDAWSVEVDPAIPRY